MKKIRKTNPPTKYSQWIEIQNELGKKDGLLFKYEDGIEREAFDDLKQKLIEEQGYLCAYTGIKIQPDTKDKDGQTLEIGTFHVEHLKPQTICNEEQDQNRNTISESLDYRNMVACYPKSSKQKISFGAPFKGGNWDRDKFISPCTDECEREFIYKFNGTVKAFFEKDEAAIYTIEILGLNCQELVEKRERKIFGFFGIGRMSQGNPLRKQKAESLLRTIESKDSEGHLKEFCFVYKQLLPAHIKTLKD